MLRSAPRQRRSALLIRGPAYSVRDEPGSRICDAALRAASRPGHD
jgi:hypothetical protein